jgi:hypothetical protein
VVAGAAVATCCTFVTKTVAAQEIGERDTTTLEESVPNSGLIASGILLLGSSYGVSVVAAGVSTYGPDNNLYAPVVGPWIDLADRKGQCGSHGAPSCSDEKLNEALLIADGIVQGIGALQIAGGFLFPTRRTVTRTEAAKLVVVPRFTGGQIGLAAAGTF